MLSKYIVGTVIFSRDTVGEISYFKSDILTPYYRFLLKSSARYRFHYVTSGPRSAVQVLPLDGDGEQCLSKSHSLLMWPLLTYFRSMAPGYVLFFSLNYYLLLLLWCHISLLAKLYWSICTQNKHIVSLNRVYK